MINMESSRAGSSFVNAQDSPSEEFSILSEENDTPTYTSNDTLSFVVLQSAVASYIDIDQKSKSIDSSSLIESLSLSEVHEKVSELLQENAKLKETLKQNNIAMKQQFNTLANWKEKMAKVQEKNKVQDKNKFAETMELVRLQIKYAMEDASLKSSCDMSTVSEMQNPKSFSIDMSLQETEEICNSKEKYEKLPSNFNELSVQVNQLSMTKSDQTTETASTRQPGIEMLGEQAGTSKSYVSNYFDQSITPNTPEHVETVNTCPNCVKCSLKDEEIEALKETVVQLEHRLQSAINTEDNILRTTLQIQQMHVDSLESKLEKWDEYKILFETQLKAYEEDFRLERQQKDLLKQQNNEIYDILMKNETDSES